MAAKVVIPNVADTEEKWSATTHLYVRYFEPFTANVGQTLVTSLKLRNSPIPLRILEAGSGAGALGVYIAQILRDDSTKGHTFTMVDLAEGMMQTARGRMTVFEDAMSLRTWTGDATSLDIPDGSIDRYISNMTVHYVPDADAWLRESARVLARGGIAGFTMWGRKSLSSALEILPIIKRRMGLVPAEGPGDFNGYHMGENDATLRARMKAAGFTTCTVWHAPSVFEALSAEAFAETMIDGSNSTKNEVLTWPEETQKAFRAEVLAAAEEILARGEPIILDVCYAVATK